MKIKRLWHTLRLWLIRGDGNRAKYARKHNIYAGIGKNVLIMDRKVPIYSNLIRFHNNIQVASGVSFLTHDATHSVLNREFLEKDKKYQEVVGCIEIMDNVFIGTGSIILNNVRIGPNAIVAAGCVVTKDVPPNSVVGGVPMRIICDYDAYLAQRERAYYPSKMKPANEKVNEQLAQYLWNQFYEEKAKKE